VATTSLLTFTEFAKLFRYLSEDRIFVEFQANKLLIFKAMKRILKLLSNFFYSLLSKIQKDNDQDPYNYPLF